MNELSIRLKQAATLLSDESMKRHLRVNQVVTSSVASVYVIVGYFACLNEVKLLDQWEEKPNVWILPSVLLSISIGLTVSVAYLFV